MPRLRVNGADLYYENQGSSGPPVMFAHGLLWSSRMFDDQVAALRERYRCIAFDWRGQGQSEVTHSGYDMDNLTHDAAALIEALGAAPCHFVGLSMGGFIGLRLAARRPQLLRSLILIETSAAPEPLGNRVQYALLALVGRRLGLSLVADRVMKVMFGRTFVGDARRSAERAEWRRRLLANDRTGATRATLGVIGRAGVEHELHRIKTPTLIVVGDEDVATPRDKALRLRNGIAGSQLVTVAHAGHTSTVEQPAAVNAALIQFLNGLDSG